MRTRGQAGLTLLELVVAVSVFALAVGGLVMTIDSGLGLARTNRHRSVAANLAAAELDALRRTPFTELVLGRVVRTETVDAVTYTVVRDALWVDNDSETGPCDSAGADPKVLRVVVEVSWPDMRGIPPVRATTIVSPPVGSYDPHSGHLAVAVRDRAAQPLPGVPVTATAGGVHRLLTTTADGCAFFAFLPPGTYAVTLERTGYVDRQGTTAPTQTVGVHVGETASVAFDFDRAATVEATLEPGAAGASLPPGVPVSWANPGLVPDGVRRGAGTGPTRTLRDLFPYTDGYALWAGGCADADPEGRGADDVPFWPGALRPAAVAVSPGGTAAATVPVAVAELTVTDLSGPGPVPVIAEHAPDAGCPDGEEYTLGTIDGSGTLLVALPHGTWTVRVPGRAWTGATGGDPDADPPVPPRMWPDLVLDPRTTGTTALVLEVS